MPCVILKAEEASIVPRSPYARTVKPQRRAMATSWAHYQRGATLWRKSFKERVSPDVIEGMVVATTLIAPHQILWSYLCGEDPKTVLS